MQLRQPIQKGLLVAAAPVLRRLPPWWSVRIYGKLRPRYLQGGFGGAIRRQRLRPHGYLMDLELDDWSERLAYVCGCYYDVEGTEVIRALVRPGDTFLDVGANVGFLSLLAARQVGEQGLVIAFEPNPRLARRLTDIFGANALRNVRVEQTALGDENGQARLDVSSHSGTSSLRDASPNGITVPVRVGDDAVLDQLVSRPRSPVFLKVDVEGFEHRVLRGFPRLLAERQPAVLVEITDAWLRQAGSSAKDLLDDARAFGLEPFRLHVGPASRLRLSPHVASAETPFQYDVLLVPRKGPWRKRIVDSALL